MDGKEHKNHLMRDYSASDPRSVKAWLRGRGDDRNKRFEEFAKSAGRSDGEDIHYGYVDKIRSEEFRQVLREDLVAINEGRGYGLLGDLAIALIGLCLGVLLYFQLSPVKAF